MDTTLYRNLFSRLSEPIFIVSSDGRLIDANRRLDIFLGYEMDSVKKMKVTQLLTARSADRLRDILMATAPPEERKEKLTLKRSDGTSISRDINILSIRNSTGENVFCFLVPIGIEENQWLGDIFDISHLEERIPGNLFNEVLLALRPETGADADEQEKPVEAMISAPLPSDFKKPTIPGMDHDETDGRYMDGLLGEGPLTYTQEGIIATDLNGIITEVNMAFKLMMGAQIALRKPDIQPERNAIREVLPALGPAHDTDTGTGVDGPAEKELTSRTGTSEDIGNPGTHGPSGKDGTLETPEPVDDPVPTGPPGRNVSISTELAEHVESREASSTEADEDAEMIKGRPLRDFIAPGHKENLDRVILELTGPRSVISINMEMVRFDNSLISVKLDASTMTEAGGKVNGLLVVVQKTESRNLGGVEEGKLQLPPIMRHPVVKKVANLVREGVVITDISGNITGIDTDMEKILGTLSETVQGSNVLGVFTANERERATSIIERIRTEKGAEGQGFSLLQESGDNVKAVLKGTLIEDPDGSQVGMMLWIRIPAARDDGSKK